MGEGTPQRTLAYECLGNFCTRFDTPFDPLASTLEPHSTEFKERCSATMTKYGQISTWLLESTSFQPTSWSWFHQQVNFTFQRTCVAYTYPTDDLCTLPTIYCLFSCFLGTSKELLSKWHSCSSLKILESFELISLEREPRHCQRRQP